MMDKISSTSLNIEKENIEKLKELFPNAVTEGKINFDVLKADLGDEIDNNIEKYQFTWPGKKEAIKIAQTPSSATLRPDKSSSKDWDTTENLYIEGDNLEVLKQLQKTYYGKIKMIYIDPPYNTGNDFVYRDNYKNSIENYKEQTNQELKSNPETNGRFHSDWLNMMYPRLLLARNLLCDEGAIFISIDENEVANLKKICDDVFGDRNFIGEIIRKTKSMTADNANNFNLQHESLLIYAKEKNNFNFVGEEKMFENYSNPDNDPNGDWCFGDPSAKSGGDSTYFPIKNPYTNIEDYPPNGRYWAFSKKTMEEYIESGRIKFKKNYKNGERGFIFKRYKNNMTSEFEPVNSLFSVDNSYMNQTATNDAKNYFENNVFNYPKPVEYIKKLIKYCNTDVVLDFFSGSATTADAVMQLNAEDGGHRKFIMVQLPEKINPENFKGNGKQIAQNAAEFLESINKPLNVCEIGKERIRRAGEKVKLSYEKEYSLNNLFANEEKLDVDIGFKVFKLDTSNIVEWDDSLKIEEKELSNRFGEVFKTDRVKEDILYEIMLKYGIFDKKVGEVSINNKTMYNIKYDDKNVVICLDDVDENDIKEIGKLQSTDVIFNEAGFKDDNAKINAVYNLNKAGVKEVKCI